jgi:hypothetical protein
VVKRLLQDKRIDPTNTGNFPLWMACNGGYAEIVRELLRIPQVDPTPNSEIPYEDDILKTYFIEGLFKRLVLKVMCQWRYLRHS